MFALVATSMAGQAKKEKRGLLGLANPGLVGYSAYSAPAPLAYSSGLAVAAPLSVAAYSAPAIAPVAVAQQVHQHTHTVEKVNVPVPYPVERTIVKHVAIDRPVPAVNIFSYFMFWNFTAESLLISVDRITLNYYSFVLFFSHIQWKLLNTCHNHTLSKKQCHK